MERNNVPVGTKERREGRGTVPRPGEMKLFAYAVREFDEKPLFDKWCAKLGVEFAYSTEYPTPENIELARGYDAISTTPYALGPEAIRRFHELGVKYLGARAIGFDHFDLPTAKELGMPVTHVFYPPSGVANYAIMLMLMCCRKMRQILDRNVVQDYTLEGKMGKELSNSTVAVLGTGKIGSTVIRHLSGFGCRMLAYDLYQNPEVAQLAEYADLETIWREADIITLHMPANPEDHHIINRESLSKMKDGVVLINTARGDLIDTSALIEAIESRKVGAAALDVLEQESGLYYADLKTVPIPNHDLALLKAFPNVIVTPHTAFYTEEAVEHMVAGTVKGLLACEQGGENPYLVQG